jgi:hypothetical protein
VELDGLEGNEDFWNMDLSDDEVPIRDTTPKHASKSIYLCWTACLLPAVHLADTMKGGQGAAASFGGLNTDTQVEEERSLSRPEKLPNGKYRY